MLPGLKASGEFDGVRYGVPYYGGVRIVVYKKSDFEKAGITAVPTSLAELEAAAGKLQAANAGQHQLLGLLLPGQVLVRRGPVRVGRRRRHRDQDEAGDVDGHAELAESQAGLDQLKNLVDKYSKAPKDGDETKNIDAFNTGNVGMMIDSWWAPDS